MNAIAKSKPWGSSYTDTHKEDRRSNTVKQVEEKWRGNSAGKCLPHKHKSLNLIFRTLVKSWVWWHAPVILALRKEKQIDLPGFPATQPILPGKLVGRRETLSQNRRWTAPENISVNLNSGLHVPVHTRPSTQPYTCTIAPP